MPRSIASKIYNTTHCLKYGLDDQNLGKLYYLPEWRSQQQTAFCNNQPEGNLTVRFDNECYEYLRRKGFAPDIEKMNLNYPKHKEFYSEAERAKDSTYEHYQQFEQGWHYEPLPRTVAELEVEVLKEMARVDPTTFGKASRPDTIYEIQVYMPVMQVYKKDDDAQRVPEEQKRPDFQPVCEKALFNSDDVRHVLY